MLHIVASVIGDIKNLAHITEIRTSDGILKQTTITRNKHGRLQKAQLTNFNAVEKAHVYINHRQTVTR